MPYTMSGNSDKNKFRINYENHEGHKLIFTSKAPCPFSNQLRCLNREDISYSLVPDIFTIGTGRSPPLRNWGEMNDTKDTKSESDPESSDFSDPWAVWFILKKNLTHFYGRRNQISAWSILCILWFLISYSKCATRSAPAGVHDLATISHRTWCIT